jgi:DNA mismatch endonuclease (patch repair protein)
MDTLTRAQRSETMSRVRAADTRPELTVRRFVHRMGFRYRLHVRALPGSPDLVFPSRRKVIFVHGCFWHGHGCRSGLNRPASNVGYWTKKLERNRKELLREGIDSMLIGDIATAKTILCDYIMHIPSATR